MGAILVGGALGVGLAAAAPAHGGARLQVPIGPAGVVDGSCAEYGAADAAVVTLAGAAGAEAFVRASADALFVCLRDLVLTENGQSQQPFAAVYLDGDHSGGALPAAADLRFRITLDAADERVEVGDGAGGWVPAPRSDWAAASARRICERTLCADAEFRIGALLVPAWDAVWGMAVVHHWLTAPGDDRIWPWTPSGALPGVPTTWADVHRAGAVLPTDTPTPSASPTGDPPTPDPSATATAGVTATLPATVAPTSAVTATASLPAPTPTGTVAPTQTLAPTEAPSPTPPGTFVPPIEAGFALDPPQAFAGGRVRATGGGFGCRAGGVTFFWMGGEPMATAEAEPFALTLTLPPRVPPGEHVVTARCADGTGTAATRRLDVLAPPPPPVAGFAGPADAVWVGRAAALSDRSAGLLVRRDWDFGDGGPQAHGPDGAHAWAAAGTYTVTLTVYDAAGRIDVARGSVTVREPVARGRAALQPDGRTVAFLDLSEGPFVAKRWEFGDGATSDAANASHTYAWPGRYSPRLVASYLGPGGQRLTRTAELGPLAVGGEAAANLAVVGLQVVQANLADSRLVERARTVARVTVDRRGDARGAAGADYLVRLRAERADGTPLAGTPMLRDRRSFTVGDADLDLHELELPAGWTVAEATLAPDPLLGAVEVWAPVRLTAALQAVPVAETSRLDNEMAREVVFGPSGAVDLFAVPLRAPDGVATDASSLLALYGRLSRDMPVAQGAVGLWLPAGDLAVGVPADRFAGAGAALEAAKLALRSSVGAVDLRGLALSVASPVPAPPSCASEVAPGGRGVWVEDSFAGGPRGRATTGLALVHALGLAVGLGHAPGAAAAGEPIDAGYPVADGHLDADGFDVDALRVLPRLDTFDHMSHEACAQERGWWSAYHHDRLAERLAARRPGMAPAVAVARVAAVAAATQEPPPGARDYAVVAGIVRPKGAAAELVTVDPIFHLDRRRDPADDGPGEGEWAFVQADEAGEPIFTRAFRPSGRGAAAGVAAGAFLEVVPWSPYTERVSVLRGAVEVWSQDVPRAWPEVAILQPASGEAWQQGHEYTVAWAALDPAGLPLAYQVALSADDGQTWRPIGATRDADQLTVRSAYLPGCSACRLRVDASNGILMGRAHSGPFSIAGPAPIAEILSPATGTVVRAGDAVWLQGVAYDHTDGPLGGGRVTWSSDLDGLLGLGQSVQAALSAGQHTIRLTAVNSLGRTAEATITLRVASTRRAIEVFLPSAARGDAAP